MHTINMPTEAVTESHIVVARDSENDIKMRGLDVYLDGKFVADLAFDDSYTATLAPGQHSVKVTNRLYTKKLAISLDAGETVTLQAGNVVTGIGVVMISVLGMGPYKVFVKELSRQPAN